METRKVQLTGESTYTVSLPKKWAAQMKIAAGDTVALVPQPNGTILVDPRIGERRTVKKKTLAVTDDSTDTLFRKLVGAYISGFTSMEVKGKLALSPQNKGVCREFRRKVIGFEVVEETASSVVLQDLLDSVDLPPKKALRRMFILVEKMFRDALSALSEKNIALAEDVLSRDEEVDRLCWLISKQYHSMLRDLGYAEKMEIGLEECLELQTVAKLLERIGDHAVRICLETKKGNGSVRPEMTALTDGMSAISLDMLSKSVDAVFRGDLAQAAAVAAMREALSKKYEEAMEKVVSLESRTAVSYTYVLESLRRTGLYATDISETAINYIIGQENVP